MAEEEKYKILSKVNYPADIKNLDVPHLKILCSDIREYLIDTISEIGGHFGGGLGAVELTVAIHKVFDTPKDLVVWDTGHQAYPHKILTGRKEMKALMMHLVPGMLQHLYLLPLGWLLQETFIKTIKR